jgi:DUF1009 family protein
MTNQIAENQAETAPRNMHLPTGNRIGLVAGEGKLPALLAKSAKEKGYQIVAMALSRMAEEHVAPYCEKTYVVAPGQLTRNLKLVNDEKIHEVIFIGKIPKMELLRNVHKLDWAAVRELTRLPNFNDDTIQFAMGDFLKTHNIRVLSQSHFLRHLFPNIGVMSKREPTVEEYMDIQFGFKVAKEIARLDIGQTVVVKDQMILAIEAIEGTDEAIRRGAQLANKPVVVVKVSKPNQDQRFDIPTVGMRTLNAMSIKEFGGVLAIEANETMVVEKEEMISFCDEHNIALVAV